MERRVVITGLGAVTPIGNDVDTFWENLKAGKCGITKITKFDSTDFKAHVAAEVKDFDPLLYMDKGEVRKNDPFSQFAIAAATQAVNDSEIMGKIDPERFGVYFGSGIGGIQTFSNQVAMFFSEAEEERVRKELKAIEQSAGRRPEDKKEEKISLDIDLLSFDDRVLKPEDLKREYVVKGLEELKYNQI